MTRMAAPIKEQDLPKEDLILAREKEIPMKIRLAYLFIKYLQPDDVITYGDWRKSLPKVMHMDQKELTNSLSFYISSWGRVGIFDKESFGVWRFKGFPMGEWSKEFANFGLKYPGSVATPPPAETVKVRKAEVIEHPVEPRKVEPKEARIPEPAPSVTFGGGGLEDKVLHQAVKDLTSLVKDQHQMILDLQGQVSKITQHLEINPMLKDLEQDEVQKFTELFAYFKQNFSRNKPSAPSRTLS